MLCVVFDPVVNLCAAFTGEQTGRHLLLTAVRADRGQADCRHSRGEESQENGCRGSLR